MKQVFVALAASAALVAGCSSTPPPHYYTLSPELQPAAAAPGPSVSVTASIPDMLDRPQFVVVVNTNEVAILEQHRWAGPLAGEVGRAIAGNLSRATGNPNVAATSQSTGRNADYRVLVDIQRFAGRLDGDVDVEALWNVRAAQGGVLRSGRSSARETAGKTYDTLVAAYNRALAKLSAEIAPALTSLPPAKH